jgi:Putative peptidoglycan binding domain
VHIQGSQNWKGSKYVVFRNYTPMWHDRIWWGSHHSRIVLIGGGWYYWNAGWWYPAWGYEPTATFVYDGPIYGYNDLDPGQVVANVQTALQEQGYYHDEVDGLLGPLTRAALADYQRDHGLYTTAAIDQPTLESLGFA